MSSTFFFTLQGGSDSFKFDETHITILCKKFKEKFANKKVGVVAIEGNQFAMDAIDEIKNKLTRLEYFFLTETVFHFENIKTLAEKNSLDIVWVLCRSRDTAVIRFSIECEIRNGDMNFSLKSYALHQGYYFSYTQGENIYYEPFTKNEFEKINI